MFDTLIYFDVHTLICVNDLYGMEEADKRLRFIANAIRESIPAEYPVPRFGGNEFLPLVSSGQFGNPSSKRYKDASSIVICNRGELH
jgi:GGDEF domain-containing protein